MLQTRQESLYLRLLPAESRRRLLQSGVAATLANGDKNLYARSLQLDLLSSRQIRKPLKVLTVRKDRTPWKQTESTDSLQGGPAAANATLKKQGKNFS